MPRFSPIVSTLIIILLLLNLGLMTWLVFNWYVRYQNRYLDQAEQALIEGSKVEAIRALSTHLEHHPGDTQTAERLEGLQKDYRNRFLEKAEARLKVGDQVAAINEYRNHIEHYPDDYQVRLKLAKLYEELNINDNAESIYRGIIDDLEGSGSRWEALARERLLRRINEWANEIKRRADGLFNKGNFEAAAEDYARVISLRSRNPALYFDSIENRRAMSALNNVIAKRAFSLWRAGHEEGLSSELESPHDADVFSGRTPDGRPSPEAMRQRKIMLANFFWDYADREFKAGNWRHAAGLYDRVLKMRTAAQGGEDPNTPTLLLNYALSEYRAGNPRRALEAVTRIQKEYAYHEKASVRQLRQDLEKALTDSGRDKAPD